MTTEMPAFIYRRLRPAELFRPFFLPVARLRAAVLGFAFAGGFRLFFDVFNVDFERPLRFAVERFVRAFFCLFLALAFFGVALRFFGRPTLRLPLPEVSS